MHLIYLAHDGAHSLAVHLNDPRRNSHRRAVIGNCIQNDRISRYLHVVADFERSEHLCSRAHEHIVAEGRVTLALILSRTSEGNALIQQAVIAELGSLADNDSHAVVNEQSLSYLCTRVYLYTRAASCSLRYYPRYCYHSMYMKPMRNAVAAHRSEAGIREKYLDSTSCSGIAFFYESYVSLDIPEQDIASCRVLFLVTDEHISPDEYFLISAPAVSPSLPKDISFLSQMLKYPQVSRLF